MRGSEHWYRPDRDMAHNFHNVVRMALERMEVSVIPEGDKVLVTETAGRLARLVGACNKCEVSEEDLVKELREMNPKAMAYIGRELLVQQCLLYREWREELAPKKRLLDDPIEI